MTYESVTLRPAAHSTLTPFSFQGLIRNSIAKLLYSLLYLSYESLMQYQNSAH